MAEGQLPAGYTELVAAGAAGNLVNTATITAPAGIVDPNPGNNSATDTDTLNVESGERYVVAFRADNPGIWLFHCHVNDHITAGMIARYQVIE